MSDEIDIDAVLASLPKTEVKESVAPDKPAKKTQKKEPKKTKEELQAETDAAVFQMLEEDADDPQRTLNRAFANSLAQRLMDNKFVPVAKKEFLIRSILEHCETAENIALYNRNQLIADLILMVKAGKAEGAKILIDMLGYNAASEKYVMNRINFGDLEEK